MKLSKLSMGVALLPKWPVLHRLLCDNLKCETEDAVANPDYQAQHNQEVAVLNGANSQTVFPSEWACGEC